jgi:hypothetical protein
MIDTQKTGLVLKTHFPKKRTISVLEKQGGMVHYITKTEDICAGTLIQYQVNNSLALPCMQNMEKIALPLLRARQDILFFHHILELCYYFVPVGSHMPEVYLLIEPFVIHENIQMSTAEKKFFLVNLFRAFGITPEREETHAALYAYQYGISVDSMGANTIELDIERKVDAWLLQCLSLHPCADQFKTVHFLVMNRNL